MKFEKITDTKIKITVPLSDIKSDNISTYNILSNSTSSQELLQKILYNAEKEIGFKVDDSKLLVEAILTSENEYTFTITKILEEDCFKEISTNSFIFKFNCFDNFVELCKFLNNLSDLNLKEFSKNFSLIFYNDTYYLYNLNIENYAMLLDYMKEIFSEFGTNVSNLDCIEGILNEYGKTIFEKNAIINCIYNFI